MGGLLNRPDKGWKFKGKRKKLFLKGDKHFCRGKLKNDNKIGFVVNRNRENNEGNSKLTCFYANVRSIVNKRDELELYVFEEKPDIIGITESWAFEDIQDSELNIDGYSMIRKDRILGEKLRGGGIILYLKNNLKFSVRDDFIFENFPECIFCDVKIGNEVTLIGICYRSPSSRKINDEALFTMITKASQGKLMLMGDFNFSDINWGIPESLNDTHPFLKCINDNFLIQHVEDTTRGKNILDLVFTSEENLIEK